MKRWSTGILLLFFLASATQSVVAQTREVPAAAWLLPGFLWKASPKVSLFGELGYSKYFRAGLGYMQGFITVHKNVVLNPGYLYLLYKDQAQSYGQEHFLMNAVIGQFSWRKFFVDDRNMLWNRISAEAAPAHYYRNRLRVVRTFQLAQQQVKIYGYGEAFFSFNDGQLMRNRIAIGASYDVIRHANMDVAYIRQWDRAGGRLHLFFIMGTWKFQ